MYAEKFSALNTSRGTEFSLADAKRSRRREALWQSGAGEAGPIGIAAKGGCATFFRSVLS